MARSVRDALLVQEVRRIGALVGDLVTYAKDLGKMVITLQKRVDAHEQYMENIVDQNRDLLDLLTLVADRPVGVVLPPKKDPPS